MIRIILIMAFSLLVMSTINVHAQSKNDRQSVIEAYRCKYSKVLQYYKFNDNDSLKYNAALFLIDNMEGHMSPEGKQMEIFKKMVSAGAINTKEGIRQLNAAWNNAGKEGTTEYVADSSVVSNRMLISNIDAAFEAWRSAPWCTDVDFNTFCNYILPYRCSSEHIGGNWRMAMRETYGSFVKGETDMARAFAVVKDRVFKDVVLSNKYCSYSLDAITSHRIGKAECGQRSILLVDVLRALGIPAALDNTPMWADYSNKSHGWTSMIGKDGMTYTVFEDDSIAKPFNPVDASVFIPHYHVKDEDYCPYTIKQAKTPVKVYREEYALVDDDTKFKPGFLANGFLRDVSGEYGLESIVTLEVDTDKEVKLCAYVSAKDWMPIACAKPVNGKVTFDNVGKNSVCTAYVIENNKRRYITSPFLVGDNGIERFYDASKSKKSEIMVNRKYPLCQYIADVWGYMRGGAFFGSNDSDFNHYDTLGVIKTMPYGMTEIQCNSIKAYRYLRYKAPYYNRSSLSELQFLSLCIDGNSYKRLQGTYTANGVDASNLKYLYDDNTATSCRGQKTEYTITVVLGEGNASHVAAIRFAPSTDLNFVEKGHLYELYYFDKSWNLINRQIALHEHLIFSDVPANALLLLKDKTAGKEERIFEYENGVQIWH